LRSVDSGRGTNVDQVRRETGSMQGAFSTRVFYLCSCALASTSPHPVDSGSRGGPEESLWHG
jgi:hypothetical protein